MVKSRSFIAAGVLSGAALLSGTAAAGAGGTTADDGTYETDERTHETEVLSVFTGLASLDRAELETLAAEALDTAFDEAAVPGGSDDDPDRAATDGDPDDLTVDDSAENAEGTHGQYVSSVARSTPPGPEHGKIVSEAARSNNSGGTEESAEDVPEGDTSDDSTGGDSTSGDSTSGDSTGGDSTGGDSDDSTGDTGGEEGVAAQSADEERPGPRGQGHGVDRGHSSGR